MLCEIFDPLQWVCQAQLAIDALKKDFPSPRIHDHVLHEWDVSLSAKDPDFLVFVVIQGLLCSRSYRARMAFENEEAYGRELCQRAQIHVHAFLCGTHFDGSFLKTHQNPDVLSIRQLVIEIRRIAFHL